MPASWQWTDAFVYRLNTNVPIVSSSLVCLPAVDAGGYGPKVLLPCARQLSPIRYCLNPSSTPQNEQDSITYDVHTAEQLINLQVESWAFAIDAAVLPLLVHSGVFHTRTCKLCDNKNGIVVGGEYALSEVLLNAGHNLATLMSRCVHLRYQHAYLSSGVINVKFILRSCTLSRALLFILVVAMCL